MNNIKPELRRVYWETTAGCNLRCLHCRRIDILTRSSPEEMTILEAQAMIDELAQMGKPVLIFSGGEPLVRKDIFTLVSYARNKGMPVAMSTNGTLVNGSMARQMKEAGVYYASISLDGARPETHDKFRGRGNYARAVRGIMFLQQAGIKVQVNFTVTKQNVEEVSEMYQVAKSLDAAALYLFLLVPVGCGIQIADSQMLNAQEVETWLQWVLKKDIEGPLPIKAICAPHYFRLEEEFRETDHSSNGKSLKRKGCLAGIHMCFVSHKGDVFPCGYLPVSAGNVRQESFREIWENSSIFAALRDPSLLKGRCGACFYREVCGGCRARAFFAHQDILQEEPYCVYEARPV